MANLENTVSAETIRKVISVFLLPFTFIYYMENFLLSHVVLFFRIAPDKPGIAIDCLTFFTIVDE